VTNLELSILVVEDDVFLNEILCEVLESEGYKVKSVSTAADAVKKILNDDEKIQLLILDYNLHHFRGLNGLDIFSIAKEKDPEIKAIMISAYERENGIEDQALSIGIGAFIEKPFLINDLVDTIDVVLKN
jgi:DNA-binding NtrC family response regulator